MAEALDFGRKVTDAEIFSPLESVQKVTQLQVLRLALGLTHRQMAARVANCHTPGSTLKERQSMNYEQRHVDEMLEGYQAAYCEYFGVCSVAILGLGISPDAARYWAWMTPEETVTEKHHRREMIRRMGITGIAGTAGLLLPVPHLVGDAQDLEGLREIGVGDIGRAQQVATRLASAYLANPDADSVWAAKAHAYTLLDILESGRAKMTLGVKAQLQSVASDAASLAGYGDMNAGRLDQADRWFDAALGLAREAGDRRLESLAHVGHAWNLLEGFNGPNRAAALESLGRSAQFHRFLPPAARAYVFGSLARERAAIGDDLVSGRFLEWSRSASVLIPYEEPGWGWYSTRGTLFGWESGPRPLYEGLRSLRLRRPQEALDLFERGLATEKSQLARLGLLTSMMEACVGLDDPERACLFGTASLDEAKNLDVGAGWERNAYASFPLEWRSLRPVMAFGERLRLAA